MLKKKSIHGTARVLGTWLAAALGGYGFAWLQVPLPWMLGPLLVVACMSIAGASVQSWIVGRNTGQWLLGTTLGLYFTPAVCAVVWQMAWAVGVAVVWAVLMGLLAGWLLLRLQRPRMPGLDWRTTFLAGSVGGASEMTLMAERAGARADLVAGAHSLRMLLVTISLPLALQWGGDLPAVQPIQEAAAGAFSWSLLALGALTLAGAGAMQRLRLSNPWFLGALFVAMALAALEWAPVAMPRALVNAAQLLIGISLGVRFTPAFVRMAPSWLGAVALMTAGMLLASAGFAAWLAPWVQQSMATMVLATAPGGIGEMSITAKVLGLAAPVVAAFQVCRLAVVLTCTLPLMRGLQCWMARKGRG